MFIIRKIPNSAVGKVKRPGIRLYTLPGNPWDITILGKSITEEGVEFSSEEVRQALSHLYSLMDYDLISVEVDGMVISSGDLYSKLTQSPVDAAAELETEPEEPAETAGIEEVPESEVKGPPTSPEKPLNQMTKNELVDWLDSVGYVREDLETMKKKDLLKFARTVLEGKG